MKKVIKILIFIIFVSISLNVKAKTFVEEIVKSYKNYTNLSDSYIVLTDHDTFITTGSKGGFDGYKNSRHTDQFMEFSFDGELIKSNFFKNDGTYRNGIDSGDGYILVGYHQKYNKFQTETDKVLQITKIDRDGNIIWDNIYDENRKGTFYKIIKTKDNNYLANGIISSIDNTKDVSILVKIKSNGDIIWSKEQDIKFDDYSIPRETNNGSFLIETYTTDGQYTYPSISLFNSDGEYIKNIDIDFEHNEITDIAYVNDNYIYASINYINNNSSIIKFDINGNIIKEKDLGDVQVSSFAITDDNYIIANSYREIYNSDDESFDRNGYVNKLDSNLNIIWNKEIKDYDYFGSSINILNDKRIIINIGWEDTIVLNIIDSDGNIIKNKRIDSNKTAYVTSDLYINGDGSFYLAGNYNYLTYFDKNLVKIWEKRNNYSSIDQSNYYRILKTNNDKVIIYGYKNNELTFNIYSSNCELLDSIKIDKDIYISDLKKLDSDNYIGIGTYSSNELYYSILNNSLEETFSKRITVSEFDNIVLLINGVYVSYDNHILIDGNYYIPNSSPYYNKNFRLELDINGNIISQEETNEETDLPNYNKIAETSSHEYITVDGSIQNLYDYKPYIKKYSPDFNLIWKKEYIPDVENSQYFSKYPGVSLNSFYFGKIIKLDDNNYAVTGDGSITLTNAPEFFFRVIMIIDSNGIIKYERFFGEPNGDGIAGLELSAARKLDDNTFRFILSNHTWEGGVSYPVIFDLYYRYDLKPKESKNGTFTVDKTIAKNKEIITINAKPKLGYIVDKIILTDTKGNKTELHELTFEMRDDDVEIEVLFKELINPKTGFSITSIITMIGVLLYFTLRKKRKA